MSDIFMNVWEDSRHRSTRYRNISAVELSMQSWLL